MIGPVLKTADVSGLTWSSAGGGKAETIRIPTGRSPFIRIYMWWMIAGRISRKNMEDALKWYLAQDVIVG